jgi:3-carboxy-cis,cis-muconate cycloisomerase
LSPEKGVEASGGLFTSLFTTDAVADSTSDEAWIRAMLDFEAALARAGARSGLVSDTAAGDIASACQAGGFDPVALGRAGRLGGNPVIPLVTALRERVGPGAAASVHLGATSQDVLDSALMLVAKNTCRLVASDLDRGIEAAASLASVYRGTIQMARTLLQPASPSTFGLRAAGWANGLMDAADRLAGLRTETLAVQLGGAAGTLASLGDGGAEVRILVARELGLACPLVPWHADRQRPAELGAALAAVCGVCGKIARDVTLLMQYEIAEVSEPAAPGRGGSSTLPQKRNPALSAILLANSRRAGGLASILLQSMDHELDRSPGAWHAEWQTLTELLRAAGGSAGIAADLLGGLEVDPARMAANLQAHGGLVMAERLKSELGAILGEGVAAGVVEESARKASRDHTDWRSELESEIERCNREAALSVDLDTMLDPAAYLGSAPAFVDAILDRYRQRASGSDR